MLFAQAATPGLEGLPKQLLRGRQVTSGAENASQVVAMRRHVGMLVSVELSIPLERPTLKALRFLEPSFEASNSGQIVERCGDRQMGLAIDPQLHLQGPAEQLPSFFDVATVVARRRQVVELDCQLRVIPTVPARQHLETLPLEALGLLELSQTHQ
jgi:hypothetical protein